MLQNILPKVFLLTILLSFMAFKSTKYAKIMTDAKKRGLFDNIRFPQLRFHYIFYKKKVLIEVSILRLFAKIYSDI